MVDHKHILNYTIATLVPYLSHKNYVKDIKWGYMQL